MSWLRDHALVMSLFLLYSALLVWHGWQGHKRTANLSDYFVGGRQLSGFALGMSFFATYVSTNTFIGLAGQSYSYGVSWLLFGVFFVGFSLLAWLFIAPRLLAVTRQLGSVTLADYIGMRFESRVARQLAAFIIVTASVLYMTAIYKGIGGALAQFLGLEYRLALLVVLLITVAYTATGGFISVVKTDVVQGVLILIGAVFMFAGVVNAAGGLRSIERFAAQPESAGLLELGGTLPFAVMLGIFVSGAMKLLVDPRQLSRFYGLAGPESIRTGLWVSTLGFLLAFTLLLPIGLYARVVLPGSFSDTDNVIPTLLASGVYGEVLSSFLLVAMVAAAMSSLDSVLLVTAASFERDLAGFGSAPSAIASADTQAQHERAAIRRTRIYVLLFSVLTLALAWSPPAGIIKLTTWAGGLFAACFFPAVLLGLYWRRGDGVAVLASYSAGIGTLVGWSISPWARVLHEVFPALAASLLAYICVALQRAPLTSAAALIPPAYSRSMRHGL